MTLSRASLRSFLSAAKIAIQNPILQSSSMTFVVGNESADLDSLCSAVVLAYVKTYAEPSTNDTLYIPLSNLGRADLALRPELRPVLRYADLSVNDLITLSDLPSPAPASARTRWILVDHNTLLGELGRRYSSRVVGCIDHHEDEHRVPAGANPRIIATAGSCASLVVHYFRQAWACFAKPEAHRWDAQLARLALAPVLIDTVNLTMESRTTHVDTEAVGFLEALILADQLAKEGEGEEDGVPAYERKAFFEEIKAAKEDIGGFSLPDLLRKDYKQWNEAGQVNLGISAVVKDIHFLLLKAGSREKFDDVLKEFAIERELSLFALMTMSFPTGEPFRRELLVWGINESGSAAAVIFANDAMSKLGLATWGTGSLNMNAPGWRRCWWQRETANSRKQVAPFLRMALNKVVRSTI